MADVGLCVRLVALVEMVRGIDASSREGCFASRMKRTLDSVQVLDDVVQRWMWAHSHGHKKSCPQESDG